jgi:hypothetical protein
MVADRFFSTEKVLAEQPAPMQEQPAPEVVAVATETAIEDTDGTAAHDAVFITQSW